jgi:hypothetical protein
MYNDNKRGPGWLGSSTGAIGPMTLGRAPAALDGRNDANYADARQGSLDEISSELVLLSLETKKLLRAHSGEIGASQEEALLHLTHLLEREMAKLLAIAQSLQSK